MKENDKDREKKREKEMQNKRHTTAVATTKQLEETVSN